MKISELKGAKLDYWVAKAARLSPTWGDKVCMLGDRSDGRFYRPSTDWADGGPIIEREHIELHCIDRNGNFLGQWVARSESAPLPLHFGPTPLIAAMRAFVASKVGEEVADV